MRGGRPAEQHDRYAEPQDPDSEFSPTPHNSLTPMKSRCPICEVRGKMVDCHRNLHRLGRGGLTTAPVPAPSARTQELRSSVPKSDASRGLRPATSPCSNAGVLR